MGQGLDALLGATLEVQDTVYIPRLKTHFTIKALSNEELRRVNERATLPGAKGEKKTDDQLLNALFIAKGTVEPDFNDKALKAHYGASDEADCVTKALLPGEMAKVLQAVLNLSGFGNEDELIDDAKN
ncbi:phage tail assembly chaperone [Paenibacillus sp. SN-8-1]|uniref:phage tail assembly chaperone n=1 Tax=Paenibacillus sp. SN-8-1 TaxID=3435409 RepID=UPI003D9A110F